jgi:hypothetical protein
MLYSINHQLPNTGATNGEALKYFAGINEGFFIFKDPVIIKSKTLEDLEAQRSRFMNRAVVLLGVFIINFLVLHYLRNEFASPENHWPAAVFIVLSAVNLMVTNPLRQILRLMRWPKAQITNDRNEVLKALKVKSKKL